MRASPRHLAALLFVAAAATPRVARAADLITVEGEGVRESGITAFIHYEAGVETLVEEIDVEVDAPRFAWVHAFPTRPLEIRPADTAVFEVLKRHTDPVPPYREVLDDTLFGPSIITVVTKRLFESPAPPADDPTPPKRFRLSLDQISFIEAGSRTSTIVADLPIDLERWFAANNLKPTRAERGELKRYYEAGWTLALAVVENARPGKARFGPMLYRFETRDPVHPVLLASTADYGRLRLDYYAAGDRPLVAAEYDTLWHERPWNAREVEAGLFVATYSQAIGDAFALELEQHYGRRAKAGAHLIKSSFRFKAAPVRDVSFVETDAVPLVPGNERRGSPIDIVVTMLLGVTPLLYTPESWFFLWLSARARERRRRKEPAFGKSLWPFYALVVAAYWLITMDGLGRVAAILPLLVGIQQLTRPDDREKKPIRVEFKKEAPKKDATASKSAPKKA